jgi:hypothetical protein
VHIHPLPQHFTFSLGTFALHQTAAISCIFNDGRPVGTTVKPWTLKKSTNPCTCRGGIDAVRG